MLEIVEYTGKFTATCKCARCAALYTVKNFYGARKSRVGDLCCECKRVLIDMKTLTPSKLAEVFIYNPVTGSLEHKLNTLRAIAGQSAYCTYVNGYSGVSVGNQLYLAHRLIWFMQTGIWPVVVDHINHNRKDNRWCNLRSVSPADNVKNCSLSKNNSLGVQGVRLLPSGNYQAYIMVNYKQINLGCYPTLMAAASARLQGENTYNFHENHGLKGQA